MARTTIAPTLHQFFPGKEKNKDTTDKVQGYYCYNYGKDHPKFLSMLEADNNINGGDDERGQEGGWQCMWATEMKEVKKSKQEDEMADWMAKKFRVPSSSFCRNLIIMFPR